MVGKRLDLHTDMCAFVVTSYRLLKAVKKLRFGKGSLDDIFADMIRASPFNAIESLDIFVV